ncbi:hypothetical protein UABAM_04964 [Candidatus Uabimicrobium amorphum]|uniref:Uncharacterized protein n=1 Tax=Uabimicrobium amorphum TaxID=2596890 RepID=A0A5S9IR53_UABAM|nr:hypothetical protein [Candidatus Uabimicrobium amorphum]BBM86578.1 hypothetical protein UABAM_04964 [Candidatus Uabimicrobium amorphum]
MEVVFLTLLGELPFFAAIIVVVAAAGYYSMGCIGVILGIIGGMLIISVFAEMRENYNNLRGFCSCCLGMLTLGFCFFIVLRGENATIWEGFALLASFAVISYWLDDGNPKKVDNHNKQKYNFVTFSCQNCRTKLRISHNFYNTKQTCPKCSKDVHVTQCQVK